MTIRSRARILVDKPLRSVLIVSSDTPETNTTNNLSIAPVTGFAPTPKIGVSIGPQATVHVGQRVRYRVTVTGRGKAGAESVRLCTKVPATLIAVHAPGTVAYRGARCRTAAQLGAGHTLGFTVSALASARGHLSPSAAATATDITRPVRAATRIHVLSPLVACASVRASLRDAPPARRSPARPAETPHGEDGVYTPYAESPLGPMSRVEMSTSSISSGSSTSGSSFTSSSSSAPIQVTGLASGLDTAKIVSQMMEIQKRPVTQLQNQQQILQARKTQLTSIQAALKKVNADALALLDPRIYRGTQKATSSDATRVAASTTTGAGVGGYQVSVGQLANAAQRTFAFTTPAAEGTITIDGHDTPRQGRRLGL